MVHNPDEPSLFPQVPPEVLNELRARGEVIQFAAGDRLFTQNEFPYDLFILLRGRVKVVQQQGRSEEILTVHKAGEFTGEIRLLTGELPIATGIAMEPVEAIRLRSEQVLQLVAERSNGSKILLRALSGRLLEADADAWKKDKLATLGELSAGLAHELNNPAAAARSAAGQLKSEIGRLSDFALQNDCRLEDEQRAVLRRLLEAAKKQHTGPPQHLDALACSDREESLITWLEERGVEEPWDLAGTLVQIGLDESQLNELAAFPLPALQAGLTWLSQTLTIAGLTKDVFLAATTITTLVNAMKRYTYMDQGALKELDLHEDLDNTLQILQHKLRQGSVHVNREYDPHLPRVCAYGSELNQVWTNLLSNALDALGGKGAVTVRTAREGDGVMVEVADNGPGIPPEILPKIFERYFTTKGVGKGTGLGLEIVQRIVRSHHGELRVQSKPGDTKFQVVLPLQQPRVADIHAESSKA